MIKGCIFNLSGTLVDRYSLTSLLSLKKIFKYRKIQIPNHLIYKDMGVSKKEHIFRIINHKKITNISV